MGKADAATKAYISKNEIFADAFNFYLYNGRQVIRPERLRELNTEELILPYGADGAVSPEQKLRDSFKELAAMEDGHTAYLLLGAENQLHVHYAAPVKALSYDVIQYSRQVQAAADSHRKKKDGRGHTAAEFLSGFYKDDRLLPVITLILFFSPERWDGPRTLREMMNTDDPAILDLLPEYRIHLISPAELEDADFSRFHSSLKNVMTFIKYSKDKTKLVSWMSQNQDSLILGKAEVDVLNTCVNANLSMDEAKEEMSMCQALMEWRAEIAEEAKKEAKKEAMAEAMAEAKKVVMAEAR
ncbi:MAG: hypothetical protein Q4C73_07715, partial [Eubacteriales bacterium]|nr:hypothetical protein [Eubacteriales bacterium]